MTEKVLCEAPDGETVRLNDGLDDNLSEEGLVIRLLAAANMFGDGTDDLLREAADRIDCLETAARHIVNGTNQQDARTFRRGLDGFKILLGI